jgi:hypothetical protein
MILLVVRLALIVAMLAAQFFSDRLKSNEEES